MVTEIFLDHHQDCLFFPNKITHWLRANNTNSILTERKTIKEQCIQLQTKLFNRLEDIIANNKS
ncbi:MAG: hypothetical protein MHMPM18_003355, partial [Marteilia pararefringens]